MFLIYLMCVLQVCDPQFKFLQVSARFGGARHDAFIWSASPFRNHMEEKYLNGERHTFLLGKSSISITLCNNFFQVLLTCKNLN